MSLHHGDNDEPVFHSNQHHILMLIVQNVIAKFVFRILLVELEELPR